MKKTLNSILLVLLAIVLAFSVSACGTEADNSSESSAVNSKAEISAESSAESSQSETPQNQGSTTESSEIEKTGVWENATYLSDKEFGNGEKTLVVEVKAEEKLVTFTVKTDKATVGEALQEQGIVEGEQGQYGLYIKKVNGITADYDIDQSYWAFYINGEYAMSGVDTTEITEGAVYKLEYTK
ncbi:MAG: DUF4430 domain-containing protein [Ruminococcaceae bacterium]|nr:DUF4430 domain-containing protein [Oscillospiraceae bacterium]